MRRAQAFLSQYRDVGVTGAVADASPHQLVALLLQGARERIRSAIGAIECGDLARKAKAISGAYAILEGLRLSLDRERGGRIADALEAIYEYGGRRLIEANANGDADRLAEVDALLNDIESAWLAIRASAAG